MANNLALFKQWTTVLDEVYKVSALTSTLDGAADLARQGANANELVIPMIDMDGLADYDRNSGYVNGDVTLTNETVKCNFDRGRMFNVDAMDNIETAGIAFGRLAGEFIRTKVVPEIDAFRLSTYAQKAGETANGTLETGEDVVKALRNASNTLDELEVPYDNRVLFITPTLKALVDDLDNTKSKAVMARFSEIKEVPQTRFYTAIEQLDGKTEGQTAGGFKPAAEAKEINFLVIHKAAPIQYTKHNVTKVISPDQNQTSDGWKFGYRNVAIADAYVNKVAGIYCHAEV